MPRLLCRQVELAIQVTSLNVQMAGFVGSDPQVRQVGEQSVASFSVSVSRKNRAGEKQTVWVRVNSWSKLSEVAEQYVRSDAKVQYPVYRRCVNFPYGIVGTYNRWRARKC